jgi:hypothetical protein
VAKSGPKPKGQVKIVWNPKFAYAIGLIATDGNLSPNGRHIHFTSKDKSLAVLFKKCLGLNVSIGKKSRANEVEKRYYVVQFGDVLFYEFLLSLGLTPRKSLTMAKIAIPDEFFSHFLRGLFDGDGSVYSYWDRRWKSSYMFYLGFTSASKLHIDWLKASLCSKLGVNGHVTSAQSVHRYYQLKYAKHESFLIFQYMYKGRESRNVCLRRKCLKIQKILSIVGEQL